MLCWGEPWLMRFIFVTIINVGSTSTNIRHQLRKYQVITSADPHMRIIVHCKVILGREQPGLLRCILLWIMPLVQDRSLDLLPGSPSLLLIYGRPPNNPIIPIWSLILFKHIFWHMSLYIMLTFNTTITFNNIASTNPLVLHAVITLSCDQTMCVWAASCHM